MIRALPFLLLALAAPPAGATDAAIAGPTCVMDGDSLQIGGKLNADGFCKGGVDVRLHGIDAPEWNQTCRRPSGGAARAERMEEWPCGQAAKRALEEMVAGRTVACQVVDRDRYRRAIAVCLAGGVDVAGELVRRGLAIAYRRFTDRYVETEDAAREARAGMWAGTFETPEAFRRRTKP